jgi:hypothetical protein
LQGIGAGIGKAFLERGFNIVGSSQKVTQSTEVAASDQQLPGDIGLALPSQSPPAISRAAPAPASHEVSQYF